MSSHENSIAWACFLLLLYIALLITFWDVRHRTRSFGPWAKSAVGAFWSSVIMFGWYHLEFWHCHLTAAEKNEAFPCHTVLCAQKENLDSQFIQQQAFISMTNNGKMQKTQILIPWVVLAMEKSLISIISNLPLVVSWKPTYVVS